jgi:hypothetical protein
MVDREITIQIIEFFKKEIYCALFIFLMYYPSSAYEIQKIFDSKLKRKKLGALRYANKISELLKEMAKKEILLYNKEGIKKRYYINPLFLIERIPIKGGHYVDNLNEVEKIMNKAFIAIFKTISDNSIKSNKKRFIKIFNEYQEKINLTTILVLLNKIVIRINDGVGEIENNSPDSCLDYDKIDDRQEKICELLRKDKKIMERFGPSEKGFKKYPDRLDFNDILEGYIEKMIIEVVRLDMEISFREGKGVVKSEHRGQHEK